ncbi:MAG TPA: nitroreductase family protein [bacterium]|nr:nitroreductase family protein [bacterium]HPN31838.1 nitroreductase family protein [bacterium]
MSLITINKEKCVKCGICIDSCPTMIINKDKDGYPVINLEAVCISCGHCSAVCPNSALDNKNAPLSKQTGLNKFPVIDFKTAENFLRSRRSIRCFKNDAVDKNKIVELLNIGRFAPTGTNSQNISYLVIDDKNQLKSITELVVEWMRNEIKNQNPITKFYEGFVRLYDSTKKDIILHGAPVLVLTLIPTGFQMGYGSSYNSIAYIELFATSMSLGSCWAGFVFLCCAANYKPLLDLLKIDASKQSVSGGIMLGYPKYTYKRLVDRRPLNVEWLNK